MPTLGSTEDVATSTDLAAKASLASPAFTGNPTAPTPTAGDNDTSIATTAFVTTAVAAGGGGGSAYKLGDADAPPASPNAKDDEFDGTSSVTWANGPYAPTAWDINSTRPGHGVLRANGLTNLVAKYQAVPGSYPYTLTAKIAGSNASGANQAVALLLAPASPATSSPVVLLGFQIGSTDVFIQRLLWSNHSTSFTSGTRGVGLPITSGGGPLRHPIAPLYARMVVASATSVKTQLSWDGWNWVTLDSALNPGFTPGVMGVGVSEFGTADLTAHFDWFRVT